MLMIEQQPAASAAPAPVQEVATRPAIEDMSLLAAISDHPGFPGIEYVSGGQGA